MSTASQTSLRLPEDINARLNALAQRTGRSKTFYILEAIKEHLANLEESYESQQIINRENPGQKGLKARKKSISELLSLPPEANLDYEIPPRSRELPRAADLS